MNVRDETTRGKYGVYGPPYTAISINARSRNFKKEPPKNNLHHLIFNKPPTILVIYI